MLESKEKTPPNLPLLMPKSKKGSDGEADGEGDLVDKDTKE